MTEEMLSLLSGHGRGQGLSSARPQKNTKEEKMSDPVTKIVYTHTDEAPALATASLLSHRSSFYLGSRHHDRNKRYFVSHSDFGKLSASFGGESTA